MILNEPEASLHPSLLDALARLLRKAAQSCQIILVSHSERLVEALCEEEDVRRILLEKLFGETRVSDEEGPRWVWPSR
jgi:predicted ATPase